MKIFVPSEDAGKCADSTKNLLQEIAKNDIVNIGDVLAKLEMASRRQKVKVLHNHTIGYSDKSGYYTQVDEIDANGKKGRKIIRKSTEEKLWQALESWYLDKKNSVTLNDVYAEWLNWKAVPGVNDKTIKRNQASWKAYYEKSSIVKKPMCKLTVKELRDWAEQTIRANNPPIDPGKKSRIFSIANGCFEYACDPDMGYLQMNNWEIAKKKINKALFCARQQPTDDETQVFTEEQEAKIKEMVLADLKKYAKQPTSAGYQILLGFQTGMRIGELCGLKWIDIHDGEIHVQRMADNESVTEHAKTDAGRRSIPITPDAQWVLDEVRKYNDAHGFSAEWVFQGKNPRYDYRLSYHAAGRKLEKLCNRLHTIKKSPHKLRKTCLSALMDAPNVNDRAVTNFAGHKDSSTTQRFYNFNRRGREETAAAIAQALAFHTA